MKKRFSFEYRDLSKDGNLELKYDEKENDKLMIETIDDIVYITGNSEGLLTLGKALIVMAEGEYEDSFHIHISEDFDARNQDSLIVTINNNSWSTKGTHAPSGNNSGTQY